MIKTKSKIQNEHCCEEILVMHLTYQDSYWLADLNSKHEVCNWTTLSALALP